MYIANMIQVIITSIGISLGVSLITTFLLFEYLDYKQRKNND